MCAVEHHDLSSFCLQMNYVMHVNLPLFIPEMLLCYSINLTKAHVQLTSLSISVTLYRYGKVSILELFGYGKNV